MGSRRSSDFSTDTHSKVESISLEFEDYPLDLVSTVRRETDSYTNEYRPKPPFTLPLVNHYIPSPPRDLPLRNTFQLIDCRKDLSYDYSTPNSTQAWTRRSSVKLNNGHSKYSIEDHDCVQKKDHGCSHWCHMICKPCIRQQNPLPEDATWWQHLRYAFLCPPHGFVSRHLALLLCAGLAYAVLWAVTGESALPGGSFFALVVLVIAGYLGGILIEKIKLPALLGMLLVGFLLRNLPVVNVAKDIDSHWSAALRNIALVVVLLRAGLGLDPLVLKKLSLVVLRLAFLPCLVETVTVALASHFLLGFPWVWGFMLGFVLGAVTPAVVVPSMLSLHLKGYGANSGIATLVIAASSVDDILAISIFTILLGVVFAEGNLVLSIIQGPLEALGGILYGIIIGCILWYIPNYNNSSSSVFRFLILFGAGLFSMFGSRAAKFPGAGALGCLSVSFVAALRWRAEGWKDEDNPVGNTLDILWLICEPFMFGLIGAEVDISQIKAETIGLGVAVIVIGVILRMIASFLVVFGAGLDIKEKLFVSFAWLPKATVQAAIGTVALDTARVKGGTQLEIDLGIKIVTIAVLSIMMMAPVGAAAIWLTGPRLLKRMSDSDEDAAIARGERLELTWDNDADLDASDLTAKMEKELTAERETVT